MELGYRGLGGSEHIGSDKMKRINWLRPGTLVKWMADGECGFVLKSWESPYDGMLNVRIQWLKCGEALESFDDSVDLYRFLRVLGRPTYNRDASKYTDSELSE